MKKKIVYVDMDCVIVDFTKSINEKIKENPEWENLEPDMIPYVFHDAVPIDGAIEAIKKLHESGKYDMFIATTSPWKNPTALNDKLEWVKKYLGEIFYKKIITTHRKDLLIGDYLIDDRVKNGAGDFKGELLRFGECYNSGITNEYPDWDSILKKLL